MSGYEFQCRLEEVSAWSELGCRAKVDPEEGEEDVGRGGVGLIDAFTVLFCFEVILETINVEFERLIMPTQSTK